MKNKILYVVASGSGGHILPALTLARRWLRGSPGGEVIFWGSNKSIDKNVIAGHEFISKIIRINLSGFSPKYPWHIAIILWWIVYTFFKASYKLIRQRPEKIICTGGLISIPICIAGLVTSTPIEVYELNAIPGKAVKFLIPFVTKIYTVFEETKKHCNFCGICFENKCHFTQYPVRFTTLERIPDSKSKMIEYVNQTYSPVKQFHIDRKTLFILGGSQGSISLNKIITKFIQTNHDLSDKIQIVHQVGVGKINQNQYIHHYDFPYITFSYTENIQFFYELADLIVCRAGAGTLFEIVFFKKPCLVVPLIASTTTHQVKNALVMAGKHPELFTIIDQKTLELNPQKLRDAIFLTTSSRL